jgi:hypothetical protein
MHLDSLGKLGDALVGAGRSDEGDKGQRMLVAHAQHFAGLLDRKIDHHETIHASAIAVLAKFVQATGVHDLIRKPQKVLVSFGGHIPSSGRLATFAHRFNSTPCEKIYTHERVVVSHQDDWNLEASCACGLDRGCKESD